MAEQVHEALMRALMLLKDYLPDIVISGGWVPYLYHRYVVANPPAEPIRTHDLDLVVPEQLPPKGRRPLDRILLEAGFTPTLASDASPPVCKYAYEKEGLEIEIEFLTKLKGSEEVVTKTVQKGLVAQALRYIEILRENTFPISIVDQLADGTKVRLTVNLPKPAAYIFQKGLIFLKRKERAKKAKDLYYIYDLLDNYREFHEKMIIDFQTFKASYPSGWIKTFVKNLERYFQTPRSEGPILVEEQYRGPMDREVFRRRVHTPTATPWAVGSAPVLSLPKEAGRASLPAGGPKPFFFLSKSLAHPQ